METARIAGTAKAQGELWGIRPRDWAEAQESFSRPLYETVLRRTEIGAGTRVLDVGCGAGLFCVLAAKRGARVAGIDATAPFIAIASERVPQGDFRTGEMEVLPYENKTFEVVTGFNSFQFAANPVNALKEARRVAKPGCAVVTATWGKPELCEAAAFLAALRPLLPPPPPGAPGPFALSPDGALEALVEQAGLAPKSVVDVDCPFEYPDLETLLRGFLSAGPSVKAIQVSGEARVRDAVTAAMAPFKLSSGGYRLEKHVPVSDRDGIVAGIARGTGLRTVAVPDGFWHLMGHWNEGRTRLEDALARSKDPSSPYLPKALLGAGRLAYRQGDRARTKALCEQGLALCRRLQDKTGIARVLIWLAILEIVEARHEEAAQLLEESLSLCREAGDKWWAVEALTFLGILAVRRGDYETAASCCSESLAVSRETANPNNIATALRNLALLALRQRDDRGADAYYREWTPGVIAECLEGLARSASLRAAHERAAVLFGAAGALLQTLGGQLPLWADELEHERCVAASRAALGEVAFADASDRGRAMALGQAVEYAMAAVQAGRPKVRAGADPLTVREKEVAALVAQGLTNRQIAAKLVVTERTPRRTCRTS